jgi:hypothetical protein
MGLTRLAIEVSFNVRALDRAKQCELYYAQEKVKS